MRMRSLSLLALVIAVAVPNTAPASPAPPEQSVASAMVPDSGPTFSIDTTFSLDVAASPRASTVADTSAFVVGVSSQADSVAISSTSYGRSSAGLFNQGRYREPAPLASTSCSTTPAAGNGRTAQPPNREYASHP